MKSGGGIDCLSDGDEGAQKWYIQGGSQQISSLLACRLETLGVEIKYNEAVSSVEYSTAESDNNVRVVTRLGRAYTASKVVVAMSPTIATKHISFDPPLHEDHQLFIRSMIPGQALKAIVICKEAFWLRPKAIRGHAGHFADCGLVHNMFHAMVAGHPALVCLATGNPARQMLDLSEDERIVVVLSQLARLHFPDMTLSSGDASSTVEGLKSALGVLYYVEKPWTLEEFSGGCFSVTFPPTGMLWKYGKRFMIREGSSGSKSSGSISKEADFGKEASNCWENCLIFASSDVSDVYHGYMEGALRAGELAASMILL